MGFSRQEYWSGKKKKEYWSGLPFPPPGDLPSPEIEHRSPALQADSLSSEPPGKPQWPPTEPGRNQGLRGSLRAPLNASSILPLRGLGGWERTPQMWTPHPTPAGVQPPCGAESHPTCLGSPRPVSPPPPPTSQEGGLLDIPSPATRSALSTGSCHHGPRPLPEPVSSQVLSLGCPSSTFLSGAQSASGPSSPECAAPQPGCRMSVCDGTPDGTAGLTWLLRFQPSCSKVWG